MTDPYALAGRHRQLDRLEWWVEYCLAVRRGNGYPPPLRLATLHLVGKRWRLGVGLRRDWLEGMSDDVPQAKLAAEARLVRAGYSLAGFNAWRPGRGGWVTDVR